MAETTYAELPDGIDAFARDPGDRERLDRPRGRTGPLRKDALDHPRPGRPGDLPDPLREPRAIHAIHAQLPG